MLTRRARSLGSLLFAFTVSACGSNAELALGAPDDGTQTPGDGEGSGGAPGHEGGLLDTSQGTSGGGDASIDGSDESNAPPAICGNGVVDSGEQCDDGNTQPADGCNGACQIEPGYTCPTPGEACVFNVAMLCGNGQIEGTEACDDDNTSDGDGCSAGCEVEQGWACTTAGQPCTPAIAPRCGDGQVNSGEQCDDGNDVGGDGCSGTCQLEQGFQCPTPGQVCEPFHYCGDGVVDPNEQCDDGNAVPGDGCNGTCQTESGYACPSPGVPCSKVWVCGNARVDPGEACDDGNTADGDGCSADCSKVEPGWLCPKNNGNGGPCTTAPTDMCGDAKLAATEQCDDGNTLSGDGCSNKCVVEAGYTCPTPGSLCSKIAFCGDGVMTSALDEQCDDGNKVSGDGCSATCTLEPNWSCLEPGKKCVSTVKCGDGKIAGEETCDDGNKVSGDGCTSSCTLEPGWQCPTAATKCIATRCGDGIIAGEEQCDDGNTKEGDGCSSACKLQTSSTTTNPTTTTPGGTITTNYKCPTPGKACVPTTCGDGKVEGTEQCDNGDTKAFDGCSPSCQWEPNCPNGACNAKCGDGILFDFAGEQCDDGNTRDGDGCSSACKIESGYQCIAQTDGSPAFLDLPMTIRDFKYASSAMNGHPDFESFVAPNTDSTPVGRYWSENLVKATLSTGAWGIPQFNQTYDPGQCSVSSGGPYYSQNCQQITSAASFSDWYSDTTGQNRAWRIDGLSLRLTRDGSGSYVFNSATDDPYKTKGKRYTGTATKGVFLPIDGKGWGNQLAGNPQDSQSNFAFTTELRYWFTYDQGSAPTFTFEGDDDVWVFVNGRLVVDLGGLHAQQKKSFTLDAATAGALGLQDKHLYEIALFHAERRSYGSNFWLTLKGFDKKHSVCTEKCGDGIKTASEQCDDGTANVDNGPYGSCTKSCKLGPYCGDSKTTGAEQCDDGTNTATYGGAQQKCGPGCKLAPYCGDGVASNGEACDEGTLNGSGYGHCNANCTLGERCGDGVKNGTEECDEGVANGSTGSKCKVNCTLKCGDGKRDPGEECDDGSYRNTGEYGKCSSTCTLGPRCGDGAKNGQEQCDDGKNDGSYGTCKADCTVAAYCGDGALQSPPETCDQGPSNSSSAYGANLCTKACKPAPYCGDHAVDGQFGEKCDDGVNSGEPGSCTVDCKDFVPLVSCGNGKLDPGELCDDGVNNGASSSRCDAHCRLKCGNGVKDPGEQCDDGKNTGAYGTCNPNCTLPGYCGDGIKNGSESCDNGAANVSSATAYGSGVCTTTCAFAPYCGDGRVDAQHGEQCDGSMSCDRNCKYSGPR